MDPNIAQLGAVIGDPARSKMLMALMGGKALTAGELADHADITAQTASSHLQKMLGHALIKVWKQGRYKYFSLQSEAVAAVLESLLNLSAHETISPFTGPQDPDLRLARVCYDHLAGHLAVALFRHLEAQGIIQHAEHVKLTPAGQTFFSSLGVDWSEAKRRPLCRACLDWSERKHHLAGWLGSWILKDLFEKGWAEKDPDSRKVFFSEHGLRKLKTRYSLQL